MQLLYKIFLYITSSLRVEIMILLFIIIYKIYFYKSLLIAVEWNRKYENDVEKNEYDN